MEHSKLLRLCTNIVTAINLIAVVFFTFYLALYGTRAGIVAFKIGAWTLLVLGCAGTALIYSLLHVVADISETNYRISQHPKD